jgi:hypothetical protein
MVVVWPSDLPQRVYRGMIYQPGDNRLVAPTDTGSDEARRRWSGKRDRIRCRMPFTTPQRDLFLVWWRNVLADGVNDFWFPEQSDAIVLGTGIPGEILGAEAGEALGVESWWLVHFDRRSEPPPFEQVGRDWDATFILTRRL